MHRGRLIMIQKDYKQDYLIRYSEIDYDKSLKPFSLLNFLQDTASDNAEALGFGYSYITPKNLMWVLLKYRIEFSEYPNNIHNLTVNTEPRGYNRLFAYRDFEISVNEKIIGRVFSMWSLVDFTNMTIANVEQALEGNPYMKKFEAKEDDLKFSKIPPLEKVDFEKEFEVRYNDIDVNRHANNGNYIVWAFEPLSLEFKSTHKPKTIDMVFKKEAKLGEKLISKVELLDEKTTVHNMQNVETGEDLCQLLCTWS